MKYRYFLLSVLLVFLSIFLYIFGVMPNGVDIKEIKSFQEVNFRKLAVDGNLVLFDVDHTLIEPLDGYVYHAHSQKAEIFRAKLQEENPHIENWHYYEGIVLQQAERPLIEPMIIEEVNMLKNSGAHVFAITYMNTGPYFPYEKLEQWRYEHLKELGFEASYPEMIFSIAGFKRNPVFYKGIIATDLMSKGKVLGKVLDQLDWAPKKIIMFDDSLNFLKSVKAECDKRKLPFQGYHYVASSEKEWDENLINFQAEYLLKNQEWLSDEKARQLMRGAE